MRTCAVAVPLLASLLAASSAYAQIGEVFVPPANQGAGRDVDGVALVGGVRFPLTAELDGMIIGARQGGLDISTGLAQLIYKVDPRFSLVGGYGYSRRQFQDRTDGSAQILRGGVFATGEVATRLVLDNLLLVEAVFRRPQDDTVAQVRNRVRLTYTLPWAPAYKPRLVASVEPFVDDQREGLARTLLQAGAGANFFRNKLEVDLFYRRQEVVGGPRDDQHAFLAQVFLRLDR